MELAEILRILWARKLTTLAVVVLAAGAGAAVRLTAHSVPTGAATVQILIDSPQSALASLVQDTTPLTARAAVFAQVMASEAVLEQVGAAAGVPAKEITAEGPYSGPGQSLDVVTPSEARGSQLLTERARYRLTFLAQANEPVVTASVQGPSAASARRLASGIFPGVKRYVSTLQQQTGTPPRQRVTIRQLGPPQAGLVNSRSRLTLMIVAAAGVLVLGMLLLLGIEGLRRRSREHAALERDFAAGLDEVALDPRSPVPVAAGVADRRAS
jgi:hypothetical protein